VSYSPRMLYRTPLAALVLSMFCLACSDDEDPPPTGNGGTGGSGGSGNTALALSSSAFAEGETIPEKHQCSRITGGQNVSPALSWTGGPSDAQSYAIVVRDLDYMNLVHWAIYDIPKGVDLPEGIEAAFEPAVPAGAKQSRFVLGTLGYYGPCSPTTVNTYQFTVHALPEPALSGLDEQSTNDAAAAAIEAASLASAPLSGES